jgi:hypothetical protein
LVHAKARRREGLPPTARAAIHLFVIPDLIRDRSLLPVADKEGRPDQVGMTLEVGGRRSVRGLL